MAAGTRTRGPGWQRPPWSPHQSFSGSWSLPFWHLAVMKIPWAECLAALQVTLLLFFFSPMKAIKRQRWSQPFGINKKIFIIHAMRRNRSKCQQMQEHPHRGRTCGLKLGSPEPESPRWHLNLYGRCPPARPDLECWHSQTHLPAQSWWGHSGICSKGC